MTYWFDAPPVLRLPRKPDARQDRVLNVIAAAVIALLAVGLALAPTPAQPPANAPVASANDD